MSKQIAEENQLTLEELQRHEKQLEDWPDAQPTLKTIQRYIHSIRSLLEENERLTKELAEKDKVLEWYSNVDVDDFGERARSVLSKYATIKESKT